MHNAGYASLNLVPNFRRPPHDSYWNSAQQQHLDLPYMVAMGQLSLPLSVSPLKDRGIAISLEIEILIPR